MAHISASFPGVTVSKQKRAWDAARASRVMVPIPVSWEIFYFQTLEQFLLAAGCRPEGASQDIILPHDVIATALPLSSKPYAILDEAFALPGEKPKPIPAVTLVTLSMSWIS